MIRFILNLLKRSDRALAIDIGGKNNTVIGGKNNNGRGGRAFSFGSKNSVVRGGDGGQ